MQSLLDRGVDKDVEGGVMPNLIYVTREKRNNKAHNYKAGALNVMVIDRTPYTLLHFIEHTRF